MNREEQIKKAQELLSDGNFEEARSLVEAIKKHDAEHTEDKKEPEVKEQEDKKEPEVKEPEIKKEQEEEKEVKKEKRSFEPKGEEIDMEKVVLDGKEITQPETEVRGFLNYVRSHNPKMDLRALPEGVKSTDVGAIIPEDIVTKTKTLKQW